jgi:hypothetical protein
MALLYGAKFLQQQAGSNLPHVFGFGTVRSVADDTLLEVWNGATLAARVSAVDKDGKLYSAAATAGDLLYAVTGGVSSVRRLDSLAIGTAAQVLQVNTGATAPEWSSTITLGDGSVSAPSHSFLNYTDAGMYADANGLYLAESGAERMRLEAVSNPSVRFKTIPVGLQYMDFYNAYSVPGTSQLTQIRQLGDDGTATEVVGGYMDFTSNEVWAAGAHGTRWGVFVCLDGGVTPQAGIRCEPTSTTMQLITYTTATFSMGTTQILTTRRTGWGTATGTATRTTFATSTVTTEQLAERVKALIDDLHGTAGHGLIGT